VDGLVFDEHFGFGVPRAARTVRRAAGIVGEQ
jgi:hypothetical protein